MIENLRVSGSVDAIAEYSYSGTDKKIPVAEIQKYFNCTKDDNDAENYDLIEGMTIDACGDNIVGVVVVAGGQGGAAFVWDAAKDELVHVSNGDYSIAATIADGKVYTLSIVEQYGAESRALLSSIACGALDVSAATEDEDVKVEGYDGSMGKLIIDGNVRKYVSDDVEITF